MGIIGIGNHHIAELVAFAGEVHLVARVLEIGAQVELASRTAARNARSRTMLVVHHVHVFIGEALERIADSRLR